MLAFGMTSIIACFPPSHNKERMTYQLLLGGYRKTFAQISADPAGAKIKVVSESPAPEMASWLESSIEPLTTPSGARVVYGISETEDGKVYGLELKDGKITVTQQRSTGGGPAHSTQPCWG
jgi:hypothetical protein